MDYEGQKLCENLFYYIILFCGAIGWVKGYLEQDFAYVFYAWSFGMIVSIIVSMLSLCLSVESHDYFESNSIILSRLATLVMRP